MAQFPQLRLELRLKIWRVAILAANRRRLIPLDEHYQVLMTSHMEKSMFDINKESRDVALTLYPVALPVSFHYDVDTEGGLVGSNTESCDDDLISIEGVIGYAGYFHASRSQGVVRVSPTHDIFVLNCNTFIWDSRSAPFPRICTPPLAVEHCGQIKHIMEVDLGTGGTWELSDDQQEYAVRQSSKNTTHTYDRDRIPSVRSCHHLWLGPFREKDFYKPLKALPGHQVFEMWGGNTVLFFGKNLKRKMFHSKQKEETFERRARIDPRPFGM